MAQQQLQQLFLQSITLNEQLVPRDWIVASVYIEKGTLNGPLLKLEIRDMTGTVIDDWKAKYGAVLVAEMGDPSGEQESFTTTFFVTSANLAADVVTLIAVSEEVRQLKIPSPVTRMYNNKTPAEVFGVYAKGLKFDLGNQKRAITCHLSAGEKPSRMLSSIARDKASMVYVCRGAMHFSPLTDLSKVEPAFVYEANNPKAEYRISKMRPIHQDFAMTADTKYRFVGYSMTEGYIEVGDPSLPPRQISDADMETLRNMQRKLIPKFDIEVDGNPDIKPGLVIEIRVYRYDEENVLDESLPQKMIVKNVAHYEDRVGYTTRMLLGVPTNV
jgi:hypothetical protein